MEKEIARELATVRAQLYDTNRRINEYFDAITDKLKEFDERLSGGADGEAYAAQLNKLVQNVVQSQDNDDSVAMQFADLYPKWAVGKSYSIGDIVSYGVNENDETQLYRVLQAHMSQDNWKPDETNSMYKAVGYSDGGVPIWTQPYGASDAYQKGDKVYYPDSNGDIYESTVDNNVWEPGVYGWDKV